MSERQLWVDHKFKLGFDIGWTSNIMSRIQDCHVRLRHHTNLLSDKSLSDKAFDKWSIKEHIGHLIDLEELWINSFQQFEQLVPELVHADMSNQKTEQSNHNSRSIQDLLNQFKQARAELIDSYASLSESAINHNANHPRIKMMMRPVDLLFFVAEHDDHHITSILRLKKDLSENES